MYGTVKIFDSNKGWGFIGRDDGMPDVFVHYTGIQGTGFRDLTPGERVTFDVEESSKGPKAVRVKISRENAGTGL